MTTIQTYIHSGFVEEYKQIENLYIHHDQHVSFTTKDGTSVDIYGLPVIITHKEEK